ncbi:MAG: hypothetical protein MJ137_08890 [Clostridia bacterium]|nr:hypothetical protein [Clostridia bacterium]
MKKLYCILLAVMMLAAMAACSGGGENTDTTAATEPESTAAPAEPLKLTGDSPYRIVYPEDADAEVKQAAMDIQKKIQQVTGKKLELKTDLLVAAAGLTEIPNEILVGETNREASADVRSTLLYKDYAIKAVGTKLVICGGGTKSTVSAVNDFLRSHVDAEAVIPADFSLRFDGKYPVSSLKINGTDIREFAIVYASREKSIYNDAMTSFAERVRDLTGVVIPAGTVTKVSSDHEIQFGDCGRGPSSGKTAGVLEYLTTADSQSLSFVSGSVIGASGAMKCFLEKNLPKTLTGDIEISVTGSEQSSVSAEIPMADDATVRVMTSNVLGGDTLVSRIPFHISVYSAYMPDVIGMQECNSSGHSGLTAGLGSVYALACNKIGSTSSTCYTPFLYLKDKYELVESGSKLFNKRWTETNTKTFAWIVLKNKETGQLSAYINGHWSLILGSYDTVKVFGVKMTDSVEGRQWREDNTREVLEKKDELRKKYGDALPVVVMGDMNANASSNSVITFSGIMSNSLNVSKGDKTTGINSFHSNPGQKPPSGTPIDILMVTGDVIDVYRHEIVTTDTALASSDHCQVVIDIAFK